SRRPQPTGGPDGWQDVYPGTDSSAAVPPGEALPASPPRPSRPEPPGDAACTLAAPPAGHGSREHVGSRPGPWLLAGTPPRWGRGFPGRGVDSRGRPADRVLSARPGE